MIDGVGGPRGWKLAVVYAVVCLIWGTTWFSMKVAVATIPPITAAGLRFTIAFPLLAILVKATPGATFTFRRKNWLLVFVALAYIAVPYALINFGEQSISSGLASLLFASVTVFLLIFSRLLSGTRIGVWQAVGVLIGIALLAVLLVGTGSGLESQNWLAPVAVLAAAVLHALTYAVLSRWGNDVPVITTEALPVGLGGVGLLLFGLLVERPDFRSFSTASWLGILYLAIVASVVGFAAYFYLLKHLSALTVSYVFVLFPVIAVFMSSLFEQSQLEPWSYGVALLMLAAFALTKIHQPNQNP
jgi:drug/metabolite transporter (DMT)-like permease